MELQVNGSNFGNRFDGVRAYFTLAHNYGAHPKSVVTSMGKTPINTKLHLLCYNSYL